MAWNLMKSRSGSHWSIGTFKVRQFNTGLSLPLFLRTKAFNKYAHDKEKILMIKFEKNAKFQSKSCVSVDVNSKEFIKEDQVVGYLDEDAIYLCPYSKGQEYLEAFLRKERII